MRGMDARQLGMVFCRTVRTRLSRPRMAPFGRLPRGREFPCVRPAYGRMVDAVVQYAVDV